MTNSQSATDKIRLVKCSPHPPGSSQSNFLKYSQEHGYVFRISPSTSPKRTPKHSISVSGKHRFSEIGITPTATNTITPTATTTNSPTTIPALVNIYTSLPPRSRMPSSHTSSITIPLSPSIPPPLPFSPRRCRNSNNQDSGGRPHYTSLSQKKSPSLGDFDTQRIQYQYF